jgi:hypothetical protein
MKKRIVQYLVAVFIFVILLNQLIGFAVTAKPWYERLFISAVSAVTGGGIGAVVGFIIGGIGVALMGTAIGLMGWVALGLAGFGIGALGGSVYTILANPQFYDLDFWKLLLIIVVCLTTAGTVGLLTTKAHEKLTTWLKRPTEEHQDQPSAAGDA